jgi:hypothetical protein
VHVFTCDRSTGSLRHKIRLDPFLKTPNRHSPVTGIEFRTWCAVARGAAVLVTHRNGRVQLYSLCTVPKLSLTPVTHLQLPPLPVDAQVPLCPTVGMEQENEYVVCGWASGEVRGHSTQTDGFLGCSRARGPKYCRPRDGWDVVEASSFQN